MSLFKAQYTGYVAVPPEQRYTEQGLSVVSFKVVHTPFRKGQAQDERAMWVRCTSFGQRADYVLANVAKGALVAFGGDAEVSLWTPQDGTPRLDITVTADYVQLLRRPKDDEAQMPHQTRAAAPEAVDQSLPF